MVNIRFITATTSTVPLQKSLHLASTPGFSNTKLSPIFELIGEDTLENQDQVLPGRIERPSMDPESITLSVELRERGGGGEMVCGASRPPLSRPYFETALLRWGRDSNSRARKADPRFSRPGR